MSLSIKEYRESVDMTQEALAVALAISRRTVANWEASGKTLENIHPFFRSELEKIKRMRERKEAK